MELMLKAASHVDFPGAASNFCEFVVSHFDKIFIIPYLTPKITQYIGSTLLFINRDNLLNWIVVLLENSFSKDYYHDFPYQIVYEALMIVQKKINLINQSLLTIPKDVVLLINCYSNLRYKEPTVPLASIF